VPLASRGTRQLEQPDRGTHQFFLVAHIIAEPRIILPQCGRSDREDVPADPKRRIIGRTNVHRGSKGLRCPWALECPVSDRRAESSPLRLLWPRVARRRHSQTIYHNACPHASPARLCHWEAPSVAATAPGVLPLPAGSALPTVPTNADPGVTQLEAGMNAGKAFAADRAAEPYRSITTAGLPRAA
jgi:hypothetical protein